MAIIAPHHHPAHFMPTDTDYRPIEDWPVDCYVQWGRPYTFRKLAEGKPAQGDDVGSDAFDPANPAFFEAFPGKLLIRGEGRTLEEAEKNAFARWRQEMACDHRWGRKDYDNGIGTCYRCMARQMVFQPIVELGAWKKPLSYTEINSIASGMIRGAAWSKYDQEPRHRTWRRRLALRAKLHGLKLPPTPPPETEPDFDDTDPYTVACKRAVLDHFLKERDRLIAEQVNPDVLVDFYQTMKLAYLGHTAKEFGVEFFPPEASASSE